MVLNIVYGVNLTLFLICFFPDDLKSTFRKLLLAQWQRILGNSSGLLCHCYILLYLFFRLLLFWNDKHRRVSPGLKVLQNLTISRKKWDQKENQYKSLTSIVVKTKAKSTEVKSCVCFQTEGYGNCLQWTGPQTFFFL